MIHRECSSAIMRAEVCVVSSASTGREGIQPAIQVAVGWLCKEIAGFVDGGVGDGEGRKQGREEKRVG